MKTIEELYTELLAIQLEADRLVQTWKKKRAKLMSKINALKAQIKEKQE